jgi:hypothetical protein
MGSSLDPDDGPHERSSKTPQGHDVRTPGPGDSSDTGADTVGEGPLDDTSDRNRTGERMNADDARRRSDHDIGTDRVVGNEEAGLGGERDDAGEVPLERGHREQ